MATSVKIIIKGIVFVCLGVACAYAQQDSTNTSLGDVARQLRAQKSKEAKPAKVFTNENIAKADAPPVESSKSAVKRPGDTEIKPKSPQEHNEKYYRATMSDLQGQLDTHKRELEVLQKKLNQNETQYYGNPQDSLMQQYSRDDINKRTAEIDAKKQQVANDEKAIENLREQLRHEDGDPAWLR